MCSVGKQHMTVIWRNQKSKTSLLLLKFLYLLLLWYFVETYHIFTTMLSVKKNNSTMRRSKRNIGSAFETGCDLFSDHKVKLRYHDISKKITASSKVGCDSDTLARDIFGQMVPHVWFGLLPSDGDNSRTVAFSVGQDWKFISKLFQDCNIVKKMRW